jgi:hypothetical protein
VRALIWSRRKSLDLATGKAPYGFTTEGPPGGKRLVPCAYTRACGRKFLEWKRQGVTWAAIYNHCWKLGITRLDGREWSEGAIKRAVRAEALLQHAEAKEHGRSGASSTSGGRSCI